MIITYEPGILNWPTEMVAKSDYDAIANELATVYALNDYNALERQKAWAKIERLEEALRGLVDGVTGDETIEECCGYQIRVARALLPQTETKGDSA